MSYTPQPNTTPARAVQYLASLPEGQKATARMLADAVAVETFDLHQNLRAAVKHGLICVEPDPANVRRNVYSLGDGATRGLATGGEIEPKDYGGLGGEAVMPAAAAREKFNQATADLSQAQLQRFLKPDPATLCCGQFDTCAKPCTPRGRAQVEAERRDADMGHNGYHHLADVLRRAYRQAATGKGAERHAQGQPFERQPMQDLIRLHGMGFATGQASKKAQEAHRLPSDRAVAELLGAINYLAGAIIAIEAGDTHHKD